MDDRDNPAYARAPEPEDLLRLCRALNAAGARYVLIGGFAVIAHGSSRFTKDIDLLVDDDPVNIVDLMGRACGLAYTDVAADSETIRLDDVDVPIASPAALLRTKDTYREQDKIDRAFLEALLRQRR